MTCIDALKGFCIPERESATMSIKNEQGTFNFKVKHSLRPEDIIELVSYVCDCVVDQDSCAYRPELKDFYLRVAVLRAYTDLDLPYDFSSWDIVYNTPIFAMVTGYEKHPVFFGHKEYDTNYVIDTEQYRQILDAIDKKIAFATTHTRL